MTTPKNPHDAALADSHSDILFSASFAGDRGFVYLLFEHQSEATDLKPLRLASYTLRILERHVSEAGGGKPALPPPASHFGCPSDARDPERLVRSVHSWRDAMRALARSESGLEALATIFRYLDRVADSTAVKTIYTTITTGDAQMEQAVVTYEDELMARGRAEGEARGRAEGEAKAVLAVLDARALAVSDEQRALILSCTDLTLLDRWVRKAATASSASELFE